MLVRSLGIAAISTLGTLLSGCGVTPPPPHAAPLSKEDNSSRDLVRRTTVLMASMGRLEDLDIGCSVYRYGPHAKRLELKGNGDGRVEECEVWRFLLERGSNFPQLAGGLRAAIPPSILTKIAKTKENPDHSDATLRAAELLVDSARTLWNDHLERGHSYPIDVQVQGAEIVISLSKNPVYRRSVDLCSQAVRVQPSDVDSWSALGLVHYEQGEFEKAAAAFERAMTLNPYDAKYPAYMARSLLWTYARDFLKSGQIPDRDEKKNQRIVSLARKSIALDPQFPDPYVVIGLAAMVDYYLSQNVFNFAFGTVHYNEALKRARPSFRRAIELDSEDPLPYLLMAEGRLLKSHDDPEGILLLERGKRVGKLPSDWAFFGPYNKLGMAFEAYWQAKVRGWTVRKHRFLGASGTNR